MKQIRFYSCLLFCVVLTCFSSCKNGEIKNPMSVGSVGSPWEVLVVMDKPAWEGLAGRTLYDILNMDVPGLPQSEAMFSVSRCDNADFTGILKPVRNIIQVEISNKYTHPKAHYYKDVWANNQAVVKLVAHDNEQFINFITNNPRIIYDFLEESEMERSLQYIRKTHNRDFSQMIYDQFGIKILVPKLMEKYKQADDFFWASNGQYKKRQDLVIYTYPYTDPNTFTEAFLLRKRDSVMKANIPGGPKGSYMARQEEVPSSYRALNLNGKYAAEIRGLWEVRGDVMGGPYVSITRLDEVNQRVVTAEIFIYEPKENKRNLLRHNEAALYSMKLPGEFKVETNNNHNGK